jgi:TetR/AcrR family transcriptional regulator
MSKTLPCSTTKRERRPDARPGEILSAALLAFSKLGFTAARMEDVAREAGVSKGTVFRYFPTKSDLFKAVVHAHIGPRFEAWRELIKHATGPTGALIEELMLRWWRDTGSTPAAAISRIFLQEAQQFPDLAEYYETHVIQPGRDILQSIFERAVARNEFRNTDFEAVKALAMAPLLMLAMTHHDSVMRSALLAPNQTPEQLISKMVDVIVHGLQQPTGEVS